MPFFQDHLELFLDHWDQLLEQTIIQAVNNSSQFTRNCWLS